jgi:hypothetical protein
MAEHPQGRRADNGLIVFYAYATNADFPVFVFPEGQGYQLACSALYVQNTNTGSTKGDGPFQDPGQHNWGTSVAPGRYRAVISTDIAAPCIEVPPVGATLKARVYNAERHEAAAVGVK